MWKYKAQQNENELREFVNILRASNVASYLEIGCKWGGTLYRVAQILPPGSRIVAVDKPTQHSSTESSLQECVKDLKQQGFDIILIIGDSTDNFVIEQVKALGPYDACLIDANHTLPFVEKDWANYGSLSNVVAFHDIS